MNWPAQLFSPAKMVYIGFIILLTQSNICYIDFKTFIYFSIIFFIAEIFHNDYFRIILNDCAKKKSLRSENNDLSISDGLPLKKVKFFYE
jgi:hypothetical protein